MCQPIEEQGLLSRVAKEKDKVWIRAVSSQVDAPRILSFNSRQVMVGCLRIHLSVRAAGLVVIVLKGDRRKGEVLGMAKLVYKPNTLQVEN